MMEPARLAAARFAAIILLSMRRICKHDPASIDIIARKTAS
jgi:hypothetical protein